MVWAQRVMRKLVNFYRDMDRGLAVMRGEEPVARYTPGVDWSKKRDSRGATSRDSISGRRCRGGSPAR